MFRRVLHLCLLLLWLAAAACGALALLVIAKPLPLPDPEAACLVYDRYGRELGRLQKEYRIPIPLQEIPAFLQQAVLAVEDHNFYQHQGFSPRGMLRAALHDLRQGRADQGGSTLTQQLAKNLFLSRERTFARKIKEAFFSLRLELHYSKDQIFQAYLNQVYFGHGAYGVSAAARTYFGRKPAELNRKELALLAGLPRGPALYSPYLNQAAAHKRIDLVLHRMVATGAISRAEAAAIRREPLRLQGSGPRSLRVFAPYFLDFVRKEAAARLDKAVETINWNELRLETTLDPRWQQAAEAALSGQLCQGAKDRQGVPQPQGALVALDPEDGGIRALVGGTDYQLSPFNRATDARRQPGSAFKPFLYLAALEHGYTLASQISCAPLTIKSGGRVYSPTDRGRPTGPQGFLRLREALAKSSNVAAVRLQELLGRETLISMARRAGITAPLKPLPSLALGAQEVSPLELAGAYCIFANGGKAVKPYAIRRIRDRQGRVLWEHTPARTAVVPPELSYLLTAALKDALGPGGTAPQVGAAFNFPVAGKTGTSQGARDAWFVGYTPDLVAAVYIGDDENRPLPGGGGKVAAPVWQAFVQQIRATLPARDFPRPIGIVSATICRGTGLLATPSCPRFTEDFTVSTAPVSYCLDHRRVVLSVCAETGLLPNAFCRQTVEKEFKWTERPREVCAECRRPRSLWDWLFNSSRLR